MGQVNITADALEEFRDTPLPIQARIAVIFERLADWPHVSGAKPLRGSLKGNFRIRTGDYRVIFRATPDHRVVTVWKIGYRGDIYD